MTSEFVVATRLEDDRPIRIHLALVRRFEPRILSARAVRGCVAVFSETDRVLLKESEQELLDQLAQTWRN